MHKLHLILIVFCCVFTSSVKAQQIQFDRLYNDYNAWEAIIQITELNDSSILLSNRTVDVFATDSTINRRLYYSRLDKNGNKITGNILSFSNEDFVYSQPFIKKEDAYFSIASFDNLDTTINKLQRHARGIYINPSTIDTVRTFNIRYHYMPNCSPGFNQPIIVSNGSFLTRASYTGKYGDSIYLFWSDSQNNIIRVKEYPQLKMDVWKILETSDKGFLLIGNQYEEGEYIFNNKGELIYKGHPERLWYVKIDSMGEFKWQKLLTGPGYELYDTISFKYKLSTQTSFRDAIQTSDGNYVLAGFIENNPYIRKINDEGDSIWEYKYFKHFTYLDSLKRKAFITNIIEKSGFLYALGYMDTLLVDSPFKQTAQFLMKLSASGKEVWTRYFITPQNSYLYQVSPSVYGFYLSGSKHDTVPKYGSQDGWLMRIDTNGCLIPGCQLINSIEEATFPANKNIVVYPNPVSSSFTIQSAKSYSSVELWSITGSLVYKENSPTEHIEVSTLPHGIYFLRIIGAGQEVITTQKICVYH
jgi:hypothetical protein